MQNRSLRSSIALIVAAVSVVMVVPACSKPRNAKIAADKGAAKGTSAADKKAAAAAKSTAGEGAADKKAGGGRPTSAPAAATATDSADTGAADDAGGGTFSVVPHISRTADGPFELPVSGKATHIRVTPIDGNNNPVSDVEPVLGAKLIALVVRNDTRFAALHVADELPRRGAPMQVTFPEGGSHVMWVLFKPAGKPLQRVPTFFQVDGAIPKAAEDTGNGRVFQAGKLEIALAAPEKVAVCAPLNIGTLWTRKTKNLKLEPRASNGTTVDYIAVNPGGTEVILGKPLADSKDAVAANPGARARLVLPTQSRWYVWAFARHGKTLSSARFFLDARGEAPPGGCGAP